MQRADRVTLISPDGDIEETLSSPPVIQTTTIRGRPIIRVRNASRVPDWVAVGAHAVAADQDGNVIEAFKVGSTGEEVAPGAGRVNEARDKVITA